MPLGRKRRGSQSTDGRNDSEDNSSLSSVPVTKRQRSASSEPLALCRDVYEMMRNERLEDGQLLCEPFIKLPKKKADPDYYITITNPIDMVAIQQKIKSGEYEDLDQMSTDVELLVNNAKAYYAEDSAEYQQAEALWDLFYGSKSRVLGDDMCGDNDNYDDENSRLSSATDDITRSMTGPCGDSMVECLKVPILKLKVASYVEGASVIAADSVPMPPSNECSSDFDAASECPSISTNQGGRLSSCSELDEQAPNELPRIMTELPSGSSRLRGPSRPYQAMGLRERRYTYRDFITPKQTRRKMQEAGNAKDKQQDTASVEEEATESVYEQLFAAVVNASDGNRSLCEAFKVLPLKSKYIDYYQVIKEPIDLRLIAQKIQSNGYASLDDMQKDLFLMIQNAKAFNKPTSTIYKDAVALRKIITSRRQELEQPNKVSATPSARIVPRIRTRGTGLGAGATPGQSLSAAIAMLRGESEDEEAVKQILPKEESQPDLPVFSVNNTEDGANAERDSDEEDSTSGDESSDLWVLLKFIMNYRTNLGLRLAEPFIRLPSKRIYPDYYLEIKKPLSMTKIQKKLKNGRYHELDELADDLNLVFENAKQYNLEESKIYKDAAKLQGMMNVRKQELLRARELLWEQSSNRSRQATPDTGGEENGLKKKRSRSTSSDEALKKRLQLLFKYINEYQFDGRRLIEIFVSLPSKKDYPNYYKVISEPIDMTLIENKIKSDKYTSQQALVDDLELMFKNARHYNEETSQVYKDAETLERHLISRVRMLPPIDDSPTGLKLQARNSFGRVKATKSLTTLPAKLQDLFNTLRDYTDARGRTLSTPFMKLPPRADIPDYYEVIRKPIDMQKVLQRMTSCQYNSVEDMVADFVLMFDNACKYNEPESLIYKDALTLQRVCLGKKAELGGDDDVNEVPDVPPLVQSLLMNLFSATFSHMDEEGRCFSDSFLELPTILQSDETNGSLRMAPSFEQIKHNLDKLRYKRMDRFQEDMFEVFEYARKVSSVDAQVYEDSIELQLFFIQHRDELCRKGEVFLSPALSYTDSNLTEMLDSLCRERASKEQRDEEERKKQAAAMCESSSNAFTAKKNSFEHNGQIYYVGDYVYVEPRDRDKGLSPQIVCIERLDKVEDGETLLYGCWFLRPNETFHVATRKFLQKEVFKSDFYDRVSFNKVLGKCYVMSVKDYSKSKPEGFSDNDVYVCESRYSGRGKCFKKIKIWQTPKNDLVNILPRDRPLVPVRVASVFAGIKPDSVLGSSLVRSVDQSQTCVLDKSREVVKLENALKNEDGFIYYEQFQCQACWVKLGDTVYLKAAGSSDQPVIIHVEKMWTNSSGEAFISGAYYVTPSQVEHTPTRLFYKKEVMRSSREGTVPMSNILGRCAVLSLKEYTTCRFTEINENDVFVCDSKYSDVDKSIKKFNKPLKRLSLSADVCDDEVYFFKRPITPCKELSPLLPKALEMSAVDEESMDCPSSVDQSFNDAGSCQGEPALDTTPTFFNKKRKSGMKAANKVRQISGYIVFAAECRKDIQAEYPGQTFGDISRIVGHKWKGLPKEVKDRYEDKARIIAAEHATKNTNNPISMSSYPPGANMTSPINASDSASSVSSQQFGGPQGFNPAMFGSSHPGPFNQQQQQQMQQHQQQHMPSPYPQNVPYNGAMANYNMRFQNPYQGPMVPQRPPQAPPMFVAVPPRTQRLVHTETYLRYIETLSCGSQSVGGWEKSLNAKAPDGLNASSCDSRLPAHWLGNGAGHHESTASALWALRDHMMKDAMTISRTLDFSQV